MNRRPTLRHGTCRGRLGLVLRFLLHIAIEGLARLLCHLLDFRFRLVLCLGGCLSVSHRRGGQLDWVDLGNRSNKGARVCGLVQCKKGGRLTDS